MDKNGENDDVAVGVPADSYGEHVKYEVKRAESYPEWESHVEIGNGIYAGAFKEDIPEFDSIGIINVIEPDYENADVGKFEFPPELIVTDENQVRLFVPRADGRKTGFIDFDSWECRKCGGRQNTGEAYVKDDIEARKPEYCQVCETNQEHTLADLPDGVKEEDVLGLFPTDGEIWNTPSAVATPELETLFDDVRAFIYEHWEGPEYLYDGLAAYAISTWIRPELDFVPHLLIHGSHESGKTRLLNTLREVSYRCIHTAAPSSAALFRAINDYNVTLYLSEYHDLPDDVQDEVDAVLKAGQKRGEVAMRATESPGGGYTPEVFDPFTHVSISTQFSVDDDMESRCFVVNTKKATREMPRQVSDGESLRNRLMGFRARVLASPRAKQAQQTVRNRMDSEGIYNRIGEKLSSILFVAELCDKDISKFVAEVVAENKESQGDTEEAAFIRSCLDVAYDELSDAPTSEVAGDWSELALKLSDVRNRFNEVEDRDVSSRYISEVRMRLNIGKTRKSDGVYINMDGLKQKLHDEADARGVAWKARGDDTDTTSEVSQKSRIETVKNTISEHEEYHPSGVPLDKAISLCNDKGLDTTKVTDDIELLLKKGELHEPQSGSLRVT
jgi:hypothetical protein